MVGDGTLFVNILLSYPIYSAVSFRLEFSRICANINAEACQFDELNVLQRGSSFFLSNVRHFASRGTRLL